MSKRGEAQKSTGSLEKLERASIDGVHRRLAKEELAPQICFSVSFASSPLFSRSLRINSANTSIESEPTG